MKKVILIEDRVFRQEKHLGQGLLTELQGFKNLRNVAGGEEFTRIKENLMTDDFSVIDEYDVLFIHRSAFDADIRNKIIAIIGETEKILVFFSGGVTGCSFTSINDAQLLIINVGLFYSKNLFLFLENDCSNILELGFGDDWRLSVLLDAYERLSFYITTYDSPKPFIKIESDIEMNSWVRSKYFSEMDGLISLDHLRSVSKSMLSNINEML
ncbi:MAG: hypothetical protein ACK5FT_08300 [Sphingomonadales bacterium]|jgi:hypothetical protein